ncbi:DUF1398 family protein [Streptococcus hongkongensis]|nr:hypothetical protein NC01_08205 [Streptococcus uberis]
MLTKENISSVQDKFGGRDFPKLVEAFIDMGMVTNTINIQTGSAVYRDAQGHQLAMPAYQVDSIAQEVNRDYFLKQLQVHQKGQTDFPTFCQDTADSGIYKWDVDLLAKTCTYYDLHNQMVYSEPIPV